MTSKAQYQDRKLSKRERLQERKLARHNKTIENQHATRAYLATMKNER